MAISLQVIFTHFGSGQSHPAAGISPIFSRVGKEKFKKPMVEGTWFTKPELPNCKVFV